MNRKKKSYLFLPFTRKSSGRGRAVKSKRFNARVSRKKMTSLTILIKNLVQAFTSALRIAVYIVLIIPSFIVIEESYKNFLDMDEFLIKKIRVDGNYFIGKEEVLRKAGINKNDSLVTIDLKEKARRIEMLPIVRSAVIKKHFPGELFIAITERDPVFVSGEKKYLLDEEGIRLPFNPEAYSVPAIVGLKYNRAGHVVESSLALYKETVDTVRRFYEIRESFPVGIASVKVSKKKHLIVIFDDDVQVKLPVPVKDKHFKRFIFVYNDLNKKEIPFRSIDMTYKDVVVKRAKMTKKL